MPFPMHRRGGLGAVSLCGSFEFGKNAAEVFVSFGLGQRFSPIKLPTSCSFLPIAARDHRYVPA